MPDEMEHDAMSPMTPLSGQILKLQIGQNYKPETAIHSVMLDLLVLMRLLRGTRHAFSDTSCKGLELFGIDGLRQA